MEAPDEVLVSETHDPDGNRVVITAALWFGKVLKDHAEMARHLGDALRAISNPDHVIPDPVFPRRRQHYLRQVGPSRWLLVILSYEQEPVRLLTAYPNRRDPPQWTE